MAKQSKKNIRYRVLKYSLAGIAGMILAVIGLRSLPAFKDTRMLTTDVQRPPAVPPNKDNILALAEPVKPVMVRIDMQEFVHALPNAVLNDPFLQQYLGLGNAPRPMQQSQWSVGTGFIINPKGLILTNAHLVGKTKKVTVVLTDGRKFPGEVKGVDTLTDLAVVKVNPGQQNLPVARIANVNQIKIGDSVAAVGDLGSNVNLGIVSNFNRLNTKAGTSDTHLDVIQTYTAIDPDYSGGPLLNQAGEIIGINTSIRSLKPGIGFAIPIDTATAIAQKLATGEQVFHPFLGIHIAILTPEVARKNNHSNKSFKQFPEISGVRVLQVFPYTPAAESGLRAGDVIVATNQQPTITPNQLQQQVSQSQVGQVLQIIIRRNDQTVPLAIRVDDLKNQRGKWLVTPLKDQLMTH